MSVGNSRYPYMPSGLEGTDGSATYDSRDQVRLHGYYLSVAEEHLKAISRIEKEGFRAYTQKDIAYRKVKSDLARAQLSAQTDLYEIDLTNKTEAAKIVAGLTENVNNNLTRLSQTRSGWHRNALEPARRAYKAGGGQNKERAFAQLVSTFENSEGELRSVGNYQMYTALKTAFMDFGMQDAATALTRAGKLGAGSAEKQALMDAISKHLPATQTSSLLKEYAGESIAYQKDHDQLMDQGATFTQLSKDLQKAIADGTATSAQATALADMMGPNTQWGNARNAAFGASVDNDALAKDIADFTTNQTSKDWHRTEYDRLMARADGTPGTQFPSEYMQDLEDLYNSGWLPTAGFEPHQVLTFRTETIEIKDPDTGEVVSTEERRKAIPGPHAMLALMNSKSEAVRAGSDRYGPKPFLGKKRGIRYFGNVTFDPSKLSPEDQLKLKNSLRMSPDLDDKGLYATAPDGSYIPANHVRELETAHLPSHFRLAKKEKAYEDIGALTGLSSIPFEVFTDGSQVYVQRLDDPSKGFFLSDRVVENGDYFAGRVTDLYHTEPEDTTKLKGLFVLDKEQGKHLRPVRNFQDLYNTPQGLEIAAAPRKQPLKDAKGLLQFFDGNGDAVAFPLLEGEKQGARWQRAKAKGYSLREAFPTPGPWNPLTATEVTFTDVEPTGPITLAGGVKDINADNLGVVPIVLGDGTELKIPNGPGTKIEALVEAERVPGILQNSMPTVMEDLRRSVQVSATGMLMTDEQGYTDTNGFGMEVTRPLDTVRNVYGLEKVKRAPPRIASLEELVSEYKTLGEVGVNIPGVSGEEAAPEAPAPGEPIPFSVTLTENPLGRKGIDGEVTEASVASYEQGRGTYEFSFSDRNNLGGAPVSIIYTSPDGASEALKGNALQNILDYAAEPSGAGSERTLIGMEQYQNWRDGLSFGSPVGEAPAEEAPSVEEEVVDEEVVDEEVVDEEVPSIEEAVADFAAVRKKDWSEFDSTTKEQAFEFEYNRVREAAEKAQEEGRLTREQGDAVAPFLSQDFREYYERLNSPREQKRATMLEKIRALRDALKPVEEDTEDTGDPYAAKDWEGKKVTMGAPHEGDTFSRESEDDVSASVSPEATATDVGEGLSLEEQDQLEAQRRAANEASLAPGGDFDQSLAKHASDILPGDEEDPQQAPYEYKRDGSELAFRKKGSEEDWKPVSDEEYDAVAAIFRGDPGRTPEQVKAGLSATGEDMTDGLRMNPYAVSDIPKDSPSSNLPVDLTPSRSTRKERKARRKNPKGPWLRSWGKRREGKVEESPEVGIEVEAGG